MKVTTITTTFLFPLLVACQPFYYEDIEDYKKTEASIPFNEPIIYTHFNVEKQELMDSLPCEWSHGRSGVWDTSYYDFGCHGGKWGGVSLFLDEHPTDKNYIHRIRLLWKEWDQGNHYMNEEAVADKFLTEVVNRFVPAPIANDVKRLFYSNKDSTITMDGAEIIYTLTPHKTYDLHRLEIRGKPDKYYQNEAYLH